MPINQNASSASVDLTEYENKISVNLFSAEGITLVTNVIGILVIRIKLNNKINVLFFVISRKHIFWVLMP